MPTHLLIVYGHFEEDTVMTGMHRYVNTSFSRKRFNCSRNINALVFHPTLSRVLGCQHKPCDLFSSYLLSSVQCTCILSNKQTNREYLAEVHQPLL